MVDRKLFPEKSAKELLVQFRETGSQEPFEEIVRRYAAMVYGVALRVTGDKHDAEDATQAVFLSLALQAKTAREITYVGPWLQKVAHRLALDVKKAKTRRKRREDKLAEQARHLANGNGHSNGNGHGNGNGNGQGNGFFGGNGHVNPADVPGSEELKAIMMEELNKLPAKYRMPLVLHYFGGLSREEMAAELGCNPSTLGVRVHRGKAMLGTRLKKRGVGLSAVAVAVLLEHVIRSTTIQPLFSASHTASAAAGVLANANAPLAAMSARIIALTRTVARSVVYAKMKVALTIILLVISAAVTTGSVVARYVDLKNIHLPRVNPVDWIRPLLRSLTPSPQVNATKSDSVADRPEEALASAEQIKPLVLHVNAGWDRVDPTPPAGFVTAAKTTHAKTQATAKTGPAAAPVTAPEPQLNAVAQSVLFPTLSVPPAQTNQLEQLRRFEFGTTTASANDAKEKTSGQTPSKDEPGKEMVVDASSTGDNLNLGAGGGGGFGKPDTYVLPENTTLRTSTLTIGDAGAGLFHQLGGSNIVAGTLTLGKQKTGVGTYQLDSGSVTAQREVIGDDGNGTFVQAGGTNTAVDSIIVGNAGSGSYRQSGGHAVVINSRPAADPTDDPNGLHIGQGKGSAGSYVLTDGTLSATPQIIGASGDGTLTQTGGTNSTGAIAIATNPDSVGKYDLNGGGLVLDSGATQTKPTTAISIGGSGKGSFNLGNADRTGAVYQVGNGGSVVIRGKPSGTGYLGGYGKVDLTGVLVNNGQVVADGFRDDRTLDLSSFSRVTSTMDNPRFNGTNGYFARRKGRLALPPLQFDKGTSTRTWGDDNADPVIDMVNSVRVTVDNAQESGLARIALLSTLRDDIPALPDGHHFIGVWSFDGSDLGGFDGADLSIRYDDAMAHTLGLNEDILKVWEYDGLAQSWERLDLQDGFIRDTFDKILTGHANGEMTYFAVSAPEPTGVSLIVLAGGAALLRRRRRSH